MKTLGIITLSGDPITRGHLWMLRESLNLFSEVELVVGHNSDKKYLFELPQRVELAKGAVHEYCAYHERSRVTVTGHVSDDYIALLAQERYDEGYEQVTFVRGLRNSMDMEYEQMLNSINHQINAFLSTIYLIPPAGQQYISSSNVKAQYKLKSWDKVANLYVTENVAEALRNK